ncbi:MAG: sphingomyelin phosphodiesterase [Chitinophagales bacterium]
MKSAIIVLLGLLTVQTVWGGDNATPAAPERDLKILSWNIYMLPALVPMAGRLERAKGIVDTLQKTDYDIIVFQEAFHRKAVTAIHDGLKSKYPYSYGPFNPANSPFKISSGVWVLSRIPLQVLDSIEYHDKKDVDCFARKGAVLLQGEFNGKKFQLMGTHMQSNENRADIRSLQFQQMHRELLYKHHIDGIPQILCGDMNTEATIQKEYCEMLNCLDAENADYEGIQKETYDGVTNRLAELAWKKQKTTFDYILLRSNGAKIRSIRRYVSVMRKLWKKDRFDLSDHYGVSCEVRF